MPKTYAVNSRFHIEDIATIAAFMKGNGLPLINRSDPICQAVELAAQIIRNNHPSLTFDFQEAFDFLSNIGLEMVKGNRSVKALANKLATTEALIQDQQTIQECQSPEETLRIQEEENEAKKRRDEELKRALKDFGRVAGLSVVD